MQMRSKRKGSLMRTLIHANVAPPKIPMNRPQKESSLLIKQKIYRATGRLESPFMKQNEVDPIRIIESPRLKEKMHRTNAEFFPNKSNNIEKQFQSRGKLFLPLEMYDPMINQEDPFQLIDICTDQNGLVYGKSKWYDKNTEIWSWRECQVLGFDSIKELFVIKWLQSGGQKRVSRLNLKFDREDQYKFEKRLNQANKNRLDAELIMKFNYIIDTMQPNIQPLQDIVKQRITFLISTYTHYQKIQHNNAGHHHSNTLMAPSQSGENLKRRHQSRSKSPSQTQKRGKTNSPSKEKLTQAEIQIRKLIDGATSAIKPPVYCHTPRFKYRDVLKLLDLSPQQRYNSKRACALLKLRNSTFPAHIDLKQIVKEFEKKNFSIKTLRKLFKELQNYFVRANHATIFEATLPFLQPSSPHFQFKAILPAQKFKSYSQRSLLPVTPDIGVIIPYQIPPQSSQELQGQKRRSRFRENLRLMNQQLHQGHKETLVILQKLNLTLSGIQNINLFQEYYRKWVKLQEYKTINKTRSTDVTRDLRNSMFDSQYQANHLVEMMYSHLEEKNTVKVQGFNTTGFNTTQTMRSQRIKRMTIQLPQEFNTRVQRFQKLMNTMYERALRDCYMNSCTKILNSFIQMREQIERSIPNLSQPGSENQINQKVFNDLVLQNKWTRKNFRRPIFKSRLIISNYQSSGNVFKVPQRQSSTNLHLNLQQHGKIVLKPSVEQWSVTISQIICSSKEYMKSIPCISTNQYGNSRKSGLIELFEQNDGEDLFTQQILKQVKDQFQLVCKPVKALLNILNEHAGVLCTTPKQFKKYLLKQCSIFHQQAESSLKESSSSNSGKTPTTTNSHQANYNAAHGNILKFLQQQLNSLQAAREVIQSILPRTKKSHSNQSSNISSYLPTLQSQYQTLKSGKSIAPSSTTFDTMQAGYLVVSNFGINSKSLRESSFKLLKQLEQIVFEYVVKLMEEDNQEIQRRVKQSLEIIAKQPNNIEQLVQLRTYNIEITKHTKPIINAINAAMAKMNLLQRFQYRLSEENYAKTWMSFSRPLQIYIATQECLHKLKNEQIVFLQELKDMSQQVEQQFTRLKSQAELVQKVAYLSQYEDTAYNANTIWQKLNGTIDCSQIINRREALFQAKETSYEELLKLRDKFKPYLTLWNLCRDYYDKKPIWTEGHLIQINRDTITKEVASSLLTLEELLQEPFRNQKAPAAVALQLQHLLQDFKPFLPIIYDLRNPALRQHHWDQLKDHTSIEELKSELQVSLNELLKNHIMEHKDIINQISDFASREQFLLSVVGRMRDQWKHIKFELDEFRQTQSYILTKVQPIWQLLDQHIVKTMQILQSPYAVNIENQVSGWKSVLFRVQQALEQWAQAQRYWLNLQPVFESEELRQILPRETQHFDQQNKLWNMYMQQTKTNPNVIDMCYSTKVGESMAGSNQKFKAIMKELNEYLDTKRIIFPRFYFLSNEELLGVLAQAKDPTSLQLYVQKCFEGIQQLRFEEKMYERQIEEQKTLTIVDDDNQSEQITKVQKKIIQITYWVVKGMLSGNGQEYIQFLQQVHPFDRKQSQAKIVARNPEIWLKEIEYQMTLALKSNLRDGLTKYPNFQQIYKAAEDSRYKYGGKIVFPPPMQRHVVEVQSHLTPNYSQFQNNLIKINEQVLQWLNQFSNQVTQLAQSIHFTQKIEAILKKGDLKLLKAQFKYQMLWVQVLSRYISENQRAEHFRYKIGLLYILQTYNRDVVSQLVRNQVTSARDFDWQAQIRYRYELAQLQPQQGNKRRLQIIDEPQNAKLRHGAQLKAKQSMLKRDELYFQLVAISRSYGFEYQGMTPRLILTPLTLRSFRTICTAMQLQLGAAAEGPTGSGKTQTVKDFAKALGRKIIVFNCSESLEINTLSKMLTGVTCCGAFSCFDQFNRIELGVISLVAQHIATIQTAIQSQSNSYISPNDGKVVKLNPSCSIFFTLNPYSPNEGDNQKVCVNGRYDIPQNLRSLFRPIAMVRADIRMISQILLSAAGFKSAHFLSIKVVNAVNFARTQLTAQEHYDFGIRTVKSVILQAIKIKHQSIFNSMEESLKDEFRQLTSGNTVSEDGFEQNQSVYLCRALKQVCVPRFIESDAFKFDQILDSLFPQVLTYEAQSNSIVSCLEALAPQMKIKLTIQFFKKVIQLYDTLKSRHGLMVIGKPMTGKTQMINSLRAAISYQANQMNSPKIRQSLDRKSAAFQKIQAQNIQAQPILIDQSDYVQTGQNDSQVTPMSSKKKKSSNKTNQIRRGKTSNFSLKSMSSMALTVNNQEQQEYTSIFQATNKQGVHTQSENKVIIQSINPKSMTLGQLFGHYDKLSHDWKEGVFGKLVKDCIQDIQSHPLRQFWLVLDGPVDPVWVQNLNTLLDDNKKLCLSNGQIIHVPNQISVFFEVQNLEEASPATISRCGMVFLPSNSLRWKMLIDPWINYLPESFKIQSKRVLYHQFIELVVSPIMDILFPDEHLTQQCDEIQREQRILNNKERKLNYISMNFAFPMIPNWLIQNLLKLYESFLLGTKKRLAVIDEERQNKERQERKRQIDLATGRRKTKQRRPSDHQLQTQSSKRGQINSTSQSGKALKLQKRYSMITNITLGGLARSQAAKKSQIDNSPAPESNLSNLSSNQGLPKNDRQLSSKQIANMFNQFIFAVVWSIGSVLDVNSRQTFNKKLKSILISEIPKKSSFYSKLTKQHRSYEAVTVYFNSAYDPRLQTWFPWAEALAPSAQDDAGNTQRSGLSQGQSRNSGILGLKYNSPKSGPFSNQFQKQNIFVPTVDSTRYSHLILHMMFHSHPIMLVGKSGTAKTSTMQQCLQTIAADQNLLLSRSSSKFSKPTERGQKNKQQGGSNSQMIDVLKIILSATTSANHIQNQVQDRLEKKRKGVWGPLPGYQSLVIFIDDLHAPQKEEYGAQPPLQLLRSWLNYSGWYHDRTAQFSKIQDLKLVAAFTTDIIVSDAYSSSTSEVNKRQSSNNTSNNLGQDSQSQISIRLARHFNVLFLPSLQKLSLERIFSAILDRGLSTRRLDFQYKNTHIWRIIRLTVDLFSNISHEFLPTPARPHYLYNIHDITRIVEGILQISPYYFRQVGQLSQEPKEQNVKRQRFSSYGSQNSSQSNIHPLNINQDYEIPKEPSGTFEQDLQKIENGKNSKRQVAIKRLLRYLYRLWLHESFRVLGDRLVTPIQIQKFNRMTNILISQVPYLDYGKINISSLMFTNFQKKNQQRHYNLLEDESKNEEKEQPPMNALEIAKNQLLQCLEQYNQPIYQMDNQARNTHMNIVLFEYAIQHIARISRILQKPGGHALLIGSGGNGRKILTKLAAFINNCQFTEINKCKQYTRLEWEQDIKNLMRKTGIYQKQTVLYLRDVTLLQKIGSKTTSGSLASFLEDINSLLTSGDVPNLLSKAQKEDVLLQMRRSRPALRKSPNLMDLYIRQVSENLKIVISVDPAGGLFGPALRQFPSLLTQTTCNWMSQLPIEAYQDVAQSFFGQIQGQVALQQNQEISYYANIPGGLGDDYTKLLEQNIQDNQMLLEKRNQISKLTVQFHAVASEQATKYKLETGKSISVTLPNYLNLLEKIKYFHSKFKCEKQREILKYRAGVQKLNQANDNVEFMHQEQQKLQPILEVKNKEVEVTLAALSEKTKEQNVVMQQVKEEEVEVSKRKQISEQIRDECQSQLNKALPELYAAIQALRTIKTQDFVMIRSYRSPPDLIKLTLDAVCILLGVKPDVSQKIVGRKKVKIYEYWQKAKRLLKDYKKLIDRLEHYDKDNIPQERMKKLREYLDNPKFVPDIIKNASEAAQGLCKWVRAIASYDVISKQIQPKKEALKLANQKFKQVKALFDIKRQQLEQVQGKMNVLKEQYDKQNGQKMQLMNKLDACVKKKDRALKLLGGLNSEKSRWETSADQLQSQLGNTLGDALLSATSVIYLGPYSQGYRVTLKQEWLNLLQVIGLQTEGAGSTGKKIFKSQKFCATKTLANPLQISTWVLKGLPNETQSIENVAFMNNTSKFPLIIDPQGQAARYIKQSDPKLHVLKLANGDYNFIEKAIINGWTLLVQDSLPDQDPTLQPLLTQSIEYKKKSAEDIEQNILGDVSARNKRIPTNETKILQQSQITTLSKKDQPTITRDQSSQIMRTISDSKQGIKLQQKQADMRKIIRLHDQYLDWNPDFRLYMTCHTHNPHIPAHFFSNMLVINFTITAGAIRQQLLSQVAWIQRQRDQEERIRILEQTTAFKQRKKDIQHEILSQLQRVGGAILQDDAMVTSLNYSKQVSQDLQNKLRSAKIVEDKLQVSRTELNPVANEATVFYFLVQDLICWSSAYRFSHEWFIENLFVKALKGAGDMHKRVGGSVAGGGLVSNSHSLAQQQKRNLLLQKQVRKALFQNMSMALYSQHRLAFTFQMAIKLRQYQGLIDRDVIKYILSGMGKQDAPPLKQTPKPKSDIIDDSLWENIYQLEQAASNFPPLIGLRKNIIDSVDKWQQFIASTQLSSQFPAPYDKVDPIAGIALAKIFRQEDVPKYCKKLIEEVLGDSFLSPHASGLKEAAASSVSENPILVLLPNHGGDDPLLQITKIAQELNKKVMSMSLGKDSFKPAEELLEQAFRSGRWLLLQNCHIGSQVLEDLFAKFKVLCDSGPDSTYPRSQLSYDFRLWLTIKPVENKIPSSVYMQCLKVCNDSPATINGILTKIYASIKANKKQVQKFESSKHISEWRKLHMALSFFHATLRLRQNYNTLGWSGFSKKQNSTLYDFNEDDFQSSKAILFEFLQNYTKSARVGSGSSGKTPANSKLSAPLNALNYITSKCIYGARIWQANDQLLLQALMKLFYNDAILNKSDYMFAGEFYDAYRVLASPYVYQVNAYLQSGMPRDQDPPMVLGLHPNADLISNVKLGHSVLKYALQITTHSQRSRGSQSLFVNNKKTLSTTQESSVLDNTKSISKASFTFDVKAATRANFLLDTINTVRQYIPKPLNFNKIKRNISATGGMSELGAVAVAQVAKYNQLIRKIRQMIQDTDLCSRGKYSGSVQTSVDKIQGIERGLTKFQVPLAWRKICYPTRKPILSFLKGLQKRINFFKNWGRTGVTPNVLELPAFFHPPSLITRVKQIFAKRSLTSYDQVTIGSSVLKLMYRVGKLEEIQQDDDQMYQGANQKEPQLQRGVSGHRKSSIMRKKSTKQMKIMTMTKQQYEFREQDEEDQDDTSLNQVLQKEIQEENLSEIESLSAANSQQMQKKNEQTNQQQPYQKQFQIKSTIKLASSKSEISTGSDHILIHSEHSNQLNSNKQSEIAPNVQEEKREDCVLINGVLLEGAGWNIQNGYLIESNPRQLQFEMPIIRLEPDIALDIQDFRPAMVSSHPSHDYKVKQYNKGGKMSTKGDLFDEYEITMYHTKDRCVRDSQVAQMRDNYILKTKVKCQGSRDNWIKRGVAFIAEYDV